MSQSLARYISKHAKVLDVGCGSGELLAELIATKGIQAYGIDIDPGNVQACVEKGINVLQTNLDDGLAAFGDYAFDYVIFSQTLQEVQYPLHLLRDIVRIGKKCIITFPNFAYYKNRLQILVGKTPKQAALPYDWFETPNIRFLSIRDFEQLCTHESIDIIQTLPLYKNGLLRTLMPDFLKNACAPKGKFIISKHVGGH